MRARMSWPRSSVRKGCAQDGLWSWAVKSISLIGTRHTSGPSRTASTITSSTTALPMASLWRRKRRHASRPGEKRALLAGLPTMTAPAGGSAGRDAGVEPAIEDVGDEVEENDETGEHEGQGHYPPRGVGQHGPKQRVTRVRPAEDT